MRSITEIAEAYGSNCIVDSFDEDASVIVNGAESTYTGRVIVLVDKGRVLISFKNGNVLDIPHDQCMIWYK